MMSRALFSLWSCLLQLLLLQLLSLQLQSEASDTSRFSVEGDGEEVTGRSSSSISTFRRFNLACDTSFAHYQDLIGHPDLSGVYDHLKKEFDHGRDHFFHDKIVPNHHGSVCRNLNLTCCKPSMEKTIEFLAENEFKFYYDEIFQAHLQTCDMPGKIFHRSSTHVISVVIRELEMRINRTLEYTLPTDTFKDLGNFLMSFTSVPNICRFPDLLDNQVQTLVELMLRVFFEDEVEDLIGNSTLSDPAVMACAKNVTKTVVGDYQRRILFFMRNHLQDLHLLSDSLLLSHQTIEAMRQHTFSRPCVEAIMRMRYCPLCSGYGDFKPCLLKCINTLRGCFADLAEMRADFMGLISAMRLLSKDLIRDMGPETFEDSYLNQFVLMMQDLRTKKDLVKEAVMLECSAIPEWNDTTDSLGERVKRRSGFLHQPIQGSKSRPREDPLIEQLDLKILDTVVEAEMGCLERVANKMNEVSDDICFISRFEVAHKGNDQCWTGSVLGIYEHPKAGLMKAQQLNNPEYAGVSLNTKPRYTQLMSSLHNMTARINATIATNKMCANSDDEDCITDPFRNCHLVEPDSTPDSGFGSVSGSGSGGSPEDSSYRERSDSDVDREVVKTPAWTPPSAVTTVHSNTIPIDNHYMDESNSNKEKPTIGPEKPTKTSVDGIFDNNVPVDHDREIFRPKEEQATTRHHQARPTTSTQLNVLPTIGEPNMGDPALSTGGQATSKATTAEHETATTTTTTATRTTTRATAGTTGVIQGETEVLSAVTSQTDSSRIGASTSSSPVLIVSSSSSFHMIPTLTTALLASLSVLCTLLS